jgi:transposase
MKAVDNASEVAAARLRMAFELFETGLDMMRQKLRREHPEWTEAQVEARLVEWLRERPGAEHGDAEGRPGRWPRATS